MCAKVFKGYGDIFYIMLENIRIVGTSHIAPESIVKVEKTIRAFNPNIVAVELDKQRLFALLHPTKAKASFRDIRHIGFKGWLFGMLGAWIEKKLGKKVGVFPGEEMIKAVKTAQTIGANIAVIDRPIQITLKRFGKALTWKEKGRFVADLFKGFLGKGVKFDLRKIPSHELVKKLIDEVKTRYPNIYKVLIEERNVYMAKQIVKLLYKYPDAKIVVVVGIGHEEGLRNLLKRYLKKEVYISN